jgi:tetratricopeptide (TPR) repeat protein
LRDVAETVVTYTIRDAGSAGHPALRYNVQVGNTPVAANVALSPQASRSFLDLSGDFNASFEHRNGKGITPQALEALGTELATLGDGWAWDQVTPLLRTGSKRLVVVASELPEVLNLPWELLRLDGASFLGRDAKCGIRRVPWVDKRLEAFGGELAPRPLRVLFMACAPQDQVSLNYEKEEEALLKALGSTQNVAFDSGEMGSFEELRQRIAEFKPHVVHLTGHGIVKDDGLGWFAFEDERGATDERSSLEMAQQLFAGSSVQCAFISGCQTGKAPPITAVGGICQGLVKEEVPLAIGWAASIADDLATDLARVFYDTLARGERVDRALVAARQAIAKACEERHYPAWALPVLYSSTTQSLVFDPDPDRPEMKPSRQGVVQQPLPGMTEGYAEHFVGRRREIQRLLPRLRDGAIQTLVLTGMGGAGKSTLATRLARKLEGERFAVVPIPSAEGKLLGSATLLESLAGAFLDAKDRDAHDVLVSPDLGVGERLRYAVGALNRGRYLLVIDNFEVNLDEDSKAVLDPELAAFCRHLVHNLVGGSRCIITCRYLPQDLAPLPRTAQEEALGEFPEPAFLKFLLSDPKVEQRYMTGELSTELLTDLHRLLGGTPRFLDQVRTLLHSISEEDLIAELKALDVAGATGGELRELRESYLEKIVTGRLFGYLPADSRAALSRAAVYNVAVGVEALAAVTQTTASEIQGFVRQWHAQAFAYPHADRAAGELWAIHGLLRGWLLSPERLGDHDRRAAHQAAGTYLRDLEKAHRQAELGLSRIDCLLEACRQFLAAGDNEAARDTTGRISGLLLRRGLHDELVRVNEDLLSHEEHPGPMNWIARSLLDRGAYQEARCWYQRGLDQADASLSWEAGVAVGGLATIDVHQGNYAAARKGLQRALEILQAIGDRSGEATALHQLATIDMYEGDYPAARKGLQRALEIRQAIGDRSGEAAALHQLATIDMHEGHYPAARKGFQRALEILQPIGDRSGEASILHNLATVDVHEGDYPAARKGLQRALEILQAIGDRSGEATAFGNLATIDRKEGNYPAARKGFQRALEIFQPIGERAEEAATLANVATIDVHEGNYPAARKGLQHALEILQSIGDRAGEAATFDLLGLVARKMGRTAGEVQLLSLCFLIHQAIGHGDTLDDWKAVAQAASQLGYSDDQLKALLDEVADSYRQDRGLGLVEKVFEDTGP